MHIHPSIYSIIILSHSNPNFSPRSIRATDNAAAIDLLSRSLPEVARLPQHAIRSLTKNALRQAAKAVPPDSESDDEIPPSSITAPLPSPSVPRAPPPNSNDMLPAARPRTPNPAPRKRRRVSTVVPAATSFLTARPTERLDDVGGIPHVLSTVRELVEWPLSRRAMYDHLGVDAPRGLLLHGPPGCGKTLLAHAVAGSLDVPFLRVSGPEIVSGVSGESERTLRGVFEHAVRLAPSIVFIDEVDAIAARREAASKDMERRIVSQLLSCIDGLASTPKRNDARSDEEDGANEGDVNSVNGMTNRPPPVVVLAATNRPESLEPALRRAGRFDREIELGAPDEAGRLAILTKLCCSLRLDSSIETDVLAKRTAGYVGADLHLLAKEAGLACIRRFATAFDSKAEIQDVQMDECEGDADNGREENGLEEKDEDSEDEAVEEMEEIFSRVDTSIETRNESKSGDDQKDEEMKKALQDCAIGMSDFEEALEKIQPSALREGFATRPNVSWDNVGSLELVREEMMMAIVEPIRRPELFASLGLHSAGGVLLYGPPGCGKTLLARAVAAESGANFISVKGPELLSKYVGDSELAVRKVFSRARCSAPCIIFFDELDALAPRRGSGGGGGESSGASERVVNMLLTEMDGFEERRQVFVVAATNRPDIIDPAMLRPGRLDKLVLVPLPDGDGRISILHTLLRNVRLAEGVNVEAVARDSRCEGYSGADLQALIRVAGEKALRERVLGDGVGSGGGQVYIEGRHFEEALKSVVPSVSSRDASSYLKMEKWLRKSRAHVREKGEDVDDGRRQE